MALLKEGESPFAAYSETGGSISDYFVNYYSNNDNTTISVNGRALIDNVDSYFPGQYNPVPFKAAFPAFDQVQKMCDEYPGLARAYENFKIAYALVEQDWKGKQDDK